MKRFIPKGDKIIITAASFIAPESESGFTANQRYDLDRCKADGEGNVFYGFAEDDEGIETYISNDRLGPFSELVVFNVESSYDNHRAQKKALRFRRMAIRAYVSVGTGWLDTKTNPYAISKKRLKQLAREWAETIINADGSIDRESYMIDTPDYEIDQAFFDEMVWEELSCW